jgi:nucleoside-diphosphate-sugar epimerase
MRILLAGATGAIGRPLVTRLVEAGHEVVGLTRRPDRAAALEAAGARGVVCDVTDRDALLRLAEEVEPDVVADETTDLPQRYDGRTMRGFYDAMVGLRLRGTPNLMDAAERTGARLVFQSIAFSYRPDGTGRPRTEDDPILGADAPEPWDVALPAIASLERRAVGQGGVVLRYGWFYGPGTHYDAGGQMYEDARRRRLPLAGRGPGGIFSFIHVDDAAEATALAIEREATGILNVVDDDPIAIHDWLPLFAAAIGARPPRRIPLWLARRVTAPLPLHVATSVPGASNARARRDLDWAPRYPSVREGFRRASETRLRRTEYAK